MRWKVLLVGILVLGIAQISSAQDKVVFGFDAGVFVPAERAFEEGALWGPYFAYDFNKDWTLKASLGLAELDYKDYGNKIGEIQEAVFGVKGLYTIAKKEKWQVYVGAGVVYFSNDYDKSYRFQQDLEDDYKEWLKHLGYDPAEVEKEATMELQANIDDAWGCDFVLGGIWDTGWGQQLTAEARYLIAEADFEMMSIGRFQERKTVFLYDGGDKDVGGFVFSIGAQFRF